jgi:tRNA threonylcarbamoyladenosine biosynthesis protein TsaE
MKLNSLKDTQKLAKKLSKIIKEKDVIFLYGEIGAGKTTFVRFLINEIEAQYKVKKSEILSPTFNIVYDYDIKKIKIYHYDLYRLKSYNDILELGMFETSEKHIKIIEWPELIKNKPKDRIEIKFKYLKSNEARKINIMGFGKWKEYKFDAI